VIAISYPALRFQRDLVNVVRGEQDLSRATRLGLKGGWLDNQLIVESTGRALKVISARKVRILPPKLAVGSLIGYIFGNPTYEIELIFDQPITHLSVEEVKRLVFKSFHDDPGWKATLDFADLRRLVEDAKSIQEIISLLRGSTR
jgi:hypothetical protein